MSACRRLAAIGLLLACSLLGCADSGPHRYFGTTRPRHPSNELWTNLGTEPEWIDPGKCSDSSGGTVLFNTFAGLVQSHPVTLEPMPDIARDWRVSSDGLEYHFTLRDSTWSDGVPLTAHDFEYAWKRVLDRATASKYATFLYPLEHAEAFHRGAIFVEGVPSETSDDDVRRAIESALPGVEVRRNRDRSLVTLFIAEEPEGSTRSIQDLRIQALQVLSKLTISGSALRARLVGAEAVGVHATDARTLDVRLEAPLPYFLDLLTFYTAMPVPRHVIERLRAQGLSEDLWTRVEHNVSNGPFRLAEWKFRQRMVFEKNPRYWDAKHVGLDRVRMSMVESSNTTLNLYEAGELDSIGTVALPSELLDHLARYEDFRRAPYLGTYFYWVNTRRPPVDDARIRRALSLAIDRDSLVRFVARGGQIPTADLVPDGLAGYRGLKSPIFDPNQARALLKDAGYGPAGKPFPPLSLIYNTSEGHKQIAEAVQQMWKRHLGLDIAIENQEWKVYLKSLQSMEFQIGRMGWIGDYADPYTFLELLRTGNGNNHSAFADAQYERLLRQANDTMDRGARLELLHRAEALAMAQVPLIPIYVYTRSELVKPYVRGYFSNYQQRLLMKYWSIDERYYAGLPAKPRAETVPARMMPESGTGKGAP